MAKNDISRIRGYALALANGPLFKIEGQTCYALSMKEVERLTLDITRQISKELLAILEME